MAIKVIKVETNSHNGHLTIHSRVVEQVGNTTTEGPLEVHGIDPLVLNNLYGGDSEVFLRSVHARMMDNHNRRKLVCDKIKSLQGQVVNFEDEEK